MLKFFNFFYYFLQWVKSWYYFFTLYNNNKRATPTLFVDISELRKKDNATGVQRVTKCILGELEKSQLQYKLCTIYAKPHGCGFFTTEENKPVRVSKNDFFFGLDLSCYLTVMNKKFLFKMKRIGMPIYFFIHDMIPIHFPKTVEKGMVNQYPKWLNFISNFTGIVGNSKSTIEDYKSWLKTNKPDVLKIQKFYYSHLGSSFTSNTSLNKNFKRKNTAKPINFLMVSTVEPRKNYRQAINAFTLLWNNNIDVVLHIVGKEGWNVEETVNLINNNPYLNKKLFWHNSGISDKELSELYKESDCVISTSLAEGFGLFLVEAASYEKPLLIRDIPIFREIAGENATYFKTDSAEEFSNVITKWLKNYKNCNIPLPKIQFISWNECTNKIIKDLSL